MRNPAWRIWAAKARWRLVYFSIKRALDNELDEGGLLVLQY